MSAVKRARAAPLYSPVQNRAKFGGGVSRVAMHETRIPNRAMKRIPGFRKSSRYWSEPRSAQSLLEPNARDYAPRAGARRTCHINAVGENLRLILMVNQNENQNEFVLVTFS